MLVGITVTGVPDLVSPSAAVNTVMALGVALAAGVAALAIRNWGRDGRSATAGALIYGFAPFITSIAVGYVDLTLVLIPPVVFLLLNEVLIKRRQLAFFIGAIAGYFEASATLHSTPAIISACLAVGMGVVVISMFRPQSEAMPLATVVQAVVGGITAFVIATAYPVAIQSTGTRSWSISVIDNGGYLRHFMNSIIPGGNGGLGGGGIGTYLAGGLLAAALVEWFRRANLRWSLLPIGAVVIIVLMNIFPRFSVHL